MMPFLPVENGHTEPPEADPVLMAENQKIKTWLVGLLEGCAGCRDEAVTWANLMGLVHVLPEGEVESEG